jgi:hypothetical protein
MKQAAASTEGTHNKPFHLTVGLAPFGRSVRRR